ncbi:integrating conjugative element protein [Halomonas colorata]|uniref:integrating conjugative element protein n=1 Tax=Halomonas colorata TaxID=2742615 RepID=UPI001D011A13|nr:integrating conjugative element protein [Halomonas colorata]
MKRVAFMRLALSFVGALATVVVCSPAMAQPAMMASQSSEVGDVAADLMPELTVVADHGGEPARPYFVAIGMAGVPESEGYVSEPQAPFSMSEQDMVPVISSLLTPGRVESRALELPPGTTPFFLVGDDALSLSWLEQRGDILRSMYAVGLVVNVDDLQGLERLRRAAVGLELRPVSGDDLAGRVGISHYPVLITASRLEQ